MINKSIKIAVTGAAGQIGYALLFRIASGEMFGPEVKVELRLLELESAMGALKGVVMELEDGAFPLLDNLSIYSDPVKAFAEVDWALLVGSVPRKAGMERGDLLKVNAKVFVQQGSALSESAKTSCKVLVVGNPCNTNAFIAKEKAKRLDPKNFYAMTMLDEYRAIAQLAGKSGIGVKDICSLTIWGNHSATMFPDFFHATIQGRPVPEVILDRQWLKEEFISIVQNRGSEIIKARGASSAASAANAIIGSVQAIEQGCVQSSLAVVSDGSYGIPEGLVFSFPVSVEKGAWSIVQGVDHSEFAKEKLSKTLNELESERAIVKEILK